jgi:taurine-pyruvate aminotransferase
MSDSKHEVLKKDLAHVWHPMAQHRTLERNPPLVVVSAKGSVIVDADGREYLDGFAGLWCVNVGYGRTELAEAAAAQMRELPYYPHTQVNIPAAKLAERLNELMGGEVKYHTYFTNSGSESNEVAFKAVRQYHKNKGAGTRYKVVSRYFSYHGTTLATLAAGGMSERKAKFEPMPQGFLHVAPPYCYRCPFGLSYPSCELACAKNLDFTLTAEGPETVAAVIAEPIMSGIGVVVPPDEYMKEVEAICRKHGVLLIIDEVINGFGRTGKMFAHQHYGIKPDLVAVAKGISSAYLPLAATLVADAVFEAFLGEPEEKRHAIQVNTYGGHAAACAVGLANIDILMEERLADRAAETGAYLLDRLKALLDHPHVGEVRGKGLLIGIELVADKATRAPVPQRVTNAVGARCMKEGLLVGRSVGAAGHLGNCITLSPPLILTRSEADRIAEVLKTAIEAEARLG